VVNANTMSKRFQVVLPDKFYKILEKVAKDEGRPVASLAAFILEARLREIEEKEQQANEG
jgi:predicted DNA-binding protein